MDFRCGPWCSDTASCFSQFLHKVQLLCSLRTTTLQAGNNYSVRALEVELPSSTQQGMLSPEKPNKQRICTSNFYGSHQKINTWQSSVREQNEKKTFYKFINAGIVTARPGRGKNISNSTRLPWNELQIHLKVA